MNDWDIPELSLSLCATCLALPVTKWGTRARSEPMPGTWHFYTHDYKFSHLFNGFDRRILQRTGASVAVEANFSTDHSMARAEALWGIYRKRQMAVSWQLSGMRIIVDLDVDPRFRDLALLGVPQGWTAYATRMHRGVPFSEIEADHAQAVAHAGTDAILFVVFGGGKKVKADCRRRGWEWVPEHRQVVAGIEADYGQG